MIKIMCGYIGFNTKLRLFG